MCVACSVALHVDSLPLSYAMLMHCSLCAAAQRFAIESGRVTVNSSIVPPDTVLKNGDLIVHKAHRHEPPVAGDEIRVVHEDDQVVRLQRWMSRGLFLVLTQ
jgi:23S rRNA-/tRNA-specific pseudouridylate synthase